MSETVAHRGREADFNMARIKSPVLVSELEYLRDRVAELEELLGLRFAIPGGFRLTTSNGGGSRPKCWTLLCLLARRQLVSRDSAMVALYDHENERPESKVIDVYLTHLRRWLRPHGITIATNWGNGWYFTPDMQKRAQALIAKLMEEG